MSINPYDYYNYMDSNIIAAFIGFFWVISAIGGAAQYVLTGISVMKLARRRGIDNAWLAWIPVANNWLFGKLAESEGKNKNLAVTLLILSIVPAFLLVVVFIMTVMYAAAEANWAYATDHTDMVGYILGITLVALLMIGVAIAQIVVRFVAYYSICKIHTGPKYMGYFLGGLIPSLFGVGILVPIMLLVMALKEPVPPAMPPYGWNPQQGAQPQYYYMPPTGQDAPPVQNIPPAQPVQPEPDGSAEANSGENPQNYYDQ